MLEALVEVSSLILIYKAEYITINSWKPHYILAIFRFISIIFLVTSLEDNDTNRQ